MVVSYTRYLRAARQLEKKFPYTERFFKQINGKIKFFLGQENICHLRRCVANIGTSFPAPTPALGKGGSQVLLVGRGRVVLFKGGGIVLLVGEGGILIALGANIGFLNGGIGEPLVEGSYWLLLGFWSI